MSAPTDNQMTEYMRAFRVAARNALKRVDAYRPESQGKDNAETMLSAVIDQFRDYHKELSEGSLAFFEKSVEVRASEFEAWYIEQLNRRNEETAASGKNPAEAWGIVPLVIDLWYGNSSMTVPIRIQRDCEVAEIAYKTVTLVRELDMQFKKYGMSRITKTSQASGNMNTQEAGSTQNQARVGEPSTQRFKVTEIKHNVQDGKAQWRVLTPIHQPFGIPIYDEVLPDSWKKHIQPGTVMKTDRWEIDALMVWDEKTSQYKAKKVVACYDVAST